MPTGRTTAWLLALADPNGPIETLPGTSLTAGELPEMLELADRHSVLPIVIEALRQLADRLGLRDELPAALAPMQAQQLRRAATSMMLRGQLAEIVAVAPAARLIVLKGPAFADRLYRDPAHRPFTDLDLLTPVEEVDAVETALADLGYRTETQAGLKHADGYGERTWLAGSGSPTSGPVEVHWNLVNSPTVRKGVSVWYNDLQTEGAEPDTPGLARLSAASLLLIAAVHGAASHMFDRLGLVCDVCQAARGTAGDVDVDWLAEALERTGAGRAMAAALHLGWTVFGEAACDDLRRKLSLPRPGLLSRAMVNRSVVLGTAWFFVRARRQGFRELLKKKQ